MSLNLTAYKPFAQGGNRLCFVHPDYFDRCIKVRRPDFTLEDRRRKKGFPKNLKPLSSFDDNLEEYHVMNQLASRFSDEVFEHVSRCFGFEDTDLGKGLTSELVRDYSDKVSHTMKQYIWDYGYTEELQKAVNVFCEFWERLGVPSRDLLLHNIVVQMDDEINIRRLVVIDGLGSSNFLPKWLMGKQSDRRKAKRKTENLRHRISVLLEARSQGQFPGTHGLLMHDGLEGQQRDGSSE